MTYKDIVNLLKNKKKDAILPDVEGGINSFNHAMGTGDIPGTGVAMAEDVRNDIAISDDIFAAIQKQFPITTFPQKGASYILPDGKFLTPKAAHNEVDEFIIKEFPEISLKDYPNSYMVDSIGCIRLNDGQKNSFKWDRYITLPPYISSEQIYSLEEWLKQYPYSEITVADTLGNIAEFNLAEGISYILSRIKKFKNTQILSEGKDMEQDLPDIHEEDIIGQEDSGISSLFIDAINDCWTNIDHYHSIIVTLDSLDRHEFDDILKEILDEKNKEVGKLQGILELLTPSSSQIEQGKDEAQEQISFDQVEEQFNADSTLDESIDITNDVDNIYQSIIENNPDINDEELEDTLYSRINSDIFSKYNIHMENGNADTIRYIVNDLMSKRITENASLKKKLFSHLNESIGRSLLKEDWVSSGSLENFSPENLVDKAFTEKCAASSIREYKDKLLYINIDPKFEFGVRNAEDKILIYIYEKDKSTESQNKIFMDSAQTEEDAISLLTAWKENYINPDGINNEENNIEISGEEEFINGEETEEF